MLYGYGLWRVRLIGGAIYVVKFCCVSAVAVANIIVVYVPNSSSVFHRYLVSGGYLEE